MRQAASDGAGVFVALATAVVLALVAWVSLPTLLTLTERKPGDRPAPPAVAQVARSKPSVAPKLVRPQTPAVTSPASARKSGAAKLRAVTYARLKVESDPRAVVSLNGVEIGRTPISNHRIPLGTHRLRIIRAGYRPQAEVIVVKGTSPISRRYQLHPLSRR
jgi:hypothetical protein